MNKYAAFLLFFLAVFVAGGLGSIWTESTVTTWYPTLAKPLWTPPSWAFPVVWSVLYIFMAIAGWLIWKAPRSKLRTAALIFWWLQLIFNAAWSGLFFGLKNPALAFIDIGLLFSSIAAAIYVFWKVDRLAAVLFFPYLLWVGFAAVLNFSILWMN